MRQFVFQFLSLSMARVTKVMSSKTKEQSLCTTKSALIVNEFCPMLFTVCNAHSSCFHLYRRTFWTNHIFFLVFRCSLLISIFFLFLFVFIVFVVCYRSTLSVTAKVGFFTFIALIVVKMIHGKLLKVFKIFAFLIFESLIQIDAFMLGSKNTFLFNFLVQCESLVDNIL